MAGLGKHLEEAAGNAQLSLDRLIGIGIGTQCDRGRLVAGLGQCRPQEFRRPMLGKELSFEVEPGGEPKVSVVGAGETVDAAMLTAPVGIYRAIEGHVRALVAGQDAPAGIGKDPRRWPLLQLLWCLPPAITHGLAAIGLETAGRIADGAAALDGSVWKFLIHAHSIIPRREQMKNKYGWSKSAFNPEPPRQRD